METGALLHEPSAPELAGWKVQRTLLGLVLIVVACLGLYLGYKGMNLESTGGDGGVLVSIVFLGASAAIGFFGLRYLMLGVQGAGVKFYERAVEADFQKGLGPMPRRRTVPLLHIRVSGGSRLTYATAITTSGHAFRLPSSFVERSDIWYLGSLGTSPIAPGGRGAKDRYAEGELTPYAHPVSDPLPDHGPPYVDPGTHPITVEVEVGPEEAPGPAPRAPAPTEAQATLAPPPARPPPETLRPSVASAGPGPPPVGAPRSPPEEREMEVLMDLPDVVPAPVTRERSIPPPPRYRPPSISVPEPPKHREMDREGLDGPSERSPEAEVPGPAPQVPSVSPPEPAPPEPAPPEPAPPEPAPPEPAPPSSDEWELEEMPPPEEERRRRPPSTGGEWEEF